jgi:hypothetical protein
MPSEVNDEDSVKREKKKKKKSKVNGREEWETKITH